MYLVRGTGMYLGKGVEIVKQQLPSCFRSQALPADNIAL